MLELGSFLNDCWTIQVGVGHKTENDMCNVHVHNVMFIRDVKASASRDSAVTTHPASMATAKRKCCRKLSVIQRRGSYLEGWVRVWSYETKSKLL